MNGVRIHTYVHQIMPLNGYFVYVDVQAVLNGSHTALGRSVVLTRGTLSSESSGGHNLDQPTDTKKLPQNITFSIEVPRHYISCLENQQQQLEVQLKVHHAVMHVDREKSEIVIIPCQGNEKIKDWQSHCKIAVELYLESLNTETLIIPSDKKDLMSPLIDTTIQTEKSLNIEYVEDRSLLIISGEQKEVSRVKKHLEDACKSIVKETITVDDQKHFLFINVKIEELLSSHSAVKATINPDNQTVTVLGFKDKCDKFIDDLTKLKRNLQSVQVSVTSMFTQFLSQQVGKDLVQYYLQEFRSEVATYFDTEGNLFVLGSSDSTAANDLATKIQNGLGCTHVSYPVLFQKSIETTAWTTLSACLEAKHLIQIRVLKNEINIIGDSQMSSLAKKEIEQFIETECWSERCFPLCDAQWRCIRTHFSKKWKKLEHKLNKESKIELMLPSINEKDPCIIIKGEKPTVASMEKEVEALLGLVVSSSNPIKETRLGVVKYFCSEKGRGKIQLIELQQQSCVQVDIKENFSKQLTVASSSLQCSKVSSSAMVGGKQSTAIEVTSSKQEATTSDTIQCSKVCSGVTAEGKFVTLYHGDITTLSVDVMVNVTNTNLQHTEGVALAIANREGPCIQKDCNAYLQTVPGINEGDVIFAKSVGSLSCKSLIHVISPTWRGGTANERSILSSTCLKALEAAAANNFQTVSLPVIGAGVFGFPVGISVKIMIETVIKYSQTNPSTSVREIAFVMFYQDEVDEFSEEMKQASLIVKAADTATSIEDTYDIIDEEEVMTTGCHFAIDNDNIPHESVSANQTVGNQNFEVFQMIEVHKGNLLEHPVSLLLPQLLADNNVYIYQE